MTAFFCAFFFAFLQHNHGKDYYYNRRLVVLRKEHARETISNGAGICIYRQRRDVQGHHFIFSSQSY